MSKFNQCAAFLRSSKFHAIMTWVWVILLLPTLLLWRESITWVVLMSWYANFVGHWSAVEGARAAEAAESK